MTSEERAKALGAILERAAKDLGEHFDSVRIICTFEDPEDGDTAAIARGHGNWYAQYGSVKDWITEVEEETRINERSDHDEGSFS